jgi:DNA-binding response OmpR family regulator
MGLHTVLLIDDDPVQLRIREQVLRAAGLEVHIATTGESALALLRTPLGRAVAAVISDHIMPGLSGPELVRQLRQSAPHVHIVIVSGLAEAEDEYQGLDITFREKPCPPAELIRLVRLLTKRAA